MIPPGVGVGTFAATSKNAAANNPVSIFATLLIPRIYRNFSDNRRYAIGLRLFQIILNCPGPAMVFLTV